MPIIGQSTDLEQHALPSGSFGYSAARLDDLGATEYTLVTIVQDVSGSVGGFRDDMEACLKEVVQACKMSPRADNLMIRLVAFHSQLEEIHGYKLLEQCNLDDYSGCLQCGGTTALFDAAETSVLAASHYAKQLVDNDFQVNGIVVVITDGEDNSSISDENAVKATFDAALKTEALESLVSILIGVGVGSSGGSLSSYLQQFKDGAGFTKYEEIAQADAKSLAKLAEFISKSISAQSQALGTGGPSVPPPSLSI